MALVPRIWGPGIHLRREVYAFDHRRDTCNRRSVAQPSFYRGEQYDSDLGLYYLRARYYNPVTGRFMSRDPEDGKPIDPKTLHKYLYAGGDPVNGWDPTGREETETALLFIRAGAAIVMFAECMEFFDVFMEETGKELSETPEEYTHASRKLAINELKCLGSWALLFGSFL